jgi:hypothetical protein
MILALLTVQERCQLNRSSCCTVWFKSSTALLRCTTLLHASPGWVVLLLF